MIHALRLMQPQGKEKLIEQLDRDRAFTRREIEHFRSEALITDEQADEMISREAPVERASEPFLLPGVQYVLSAWYSLGSTVVQFGGLAPAVADLSGMLYPSRSMWLRDEGATKEERGLMLRFFRLLDRELYALKCKELAEALDG